MSLWLAMRDLGGIELARGRGAFAQIFIVGRRVSRSRRLPP